MSTQLHEQIGKGALDDQQLLAIEGSKNSTGSRDSTSNWTESEKGFKMQRHCQARQTRKSNLQVSKCELRKDQELQTEASSVHTSPVTLEEQDASQPQDPGPPRHRKCEKFFQKPP